MVSGDFSWDECRSDLDLQNYTDDDDKRGEGRGPLAVVQLSVI